MSVSIAIIVWYLRQHHAICINAQSVFTIKVKMILNSFFSFFAWSEGLYSMHFYFFARFCEGAKLCLPLLFVLFVFFLIFFFARMTRPKAQRFAPLSFIFSPKFLLERIYFFFFPLSFTLTRHEIASSKAWHLKSVLK